MAENAGVIADQEKLRVILCERGLPLKLGAKLTATERKIHDVLCAAYNFATGEVALEMPGNVLHRCGPEFKKLWQVTATQPAAQGKLDVTFAMTPEAIKTTLRTGVTKDSGMFKAKVNTVRLHASWARYLRTKSRTAPAEARVDWSKAEQQAKRHNQAVTEQILDGKTFNAHKDNPWARKNLRNKNQ